MWYAPDAPFGGYKQAGIGREMGVAGLDEFLELARHASLVPVYRQLISDTLTPVSAFCKSFASTQPSEQKVVHEP